MLLAVGSARSDPIRLDQRLRDAEIRSPLTRVRAVESLLEIPGVPATTVFTRDFESDPDPIEADPGGCAIRPRPDGMGRAIVYRGAAPFRCLFVLPVEPSAHYVVLRSIRTDQSVVDLAVMESRVELEHPETPNHEADLERVLNEEQTFLARRTTLYTHHFPNAQPNRWQADGLHLFTTPHTRSLVVMVQDAEAIISGKSRNAWFDDLEVRRLKPRPLQELALFKGFGLAPGADPQLGIAKHAQLLPVGENTVVPPHDANYDFRYALFAPANTTITYDLEIPPNARLYFSYALFKASRPGDAVRFRVLAITADREVELFRRRVVLDAEGKNWHWKEARLDLSGFAGRSVKLRLETQAPPKTRGYALWGTPMIDTPRRAGDPPNVLVIAVDTLRADRLSAYGYGRDTSARIEKLAADGVLFERAVANSNWTAPSFASLLTGLVPSQHLVIHRTRSISPETTTLAEYFRDAGWLTRGISYKAYLYNMGFEQGFDSWFGVPAAASTADPVIAKTIQWLRTHGDRRFFLFVHFNDPHQPFNQPEPFVSRYLEIEALNRLGLELPFYTTLSGGVEGCQLCVSGGESVPAFKTAASDLYDGEIAYLDDRIGRLIDMLKRNDLYDDTVVALVSDHGESLFERGQFLGHGGVHLTDEVIRVPMIVRPHREFDAETKASGARGGIVRQQVRLFDLMPTLLDLAGIEHDASAIPARSLLPGLREPVSGIAQRVSVSESIRMNVIAVSKRGWKYVLSHPPGRPIEESLFNLVSDPGEHSNVIANDPGVAAELRGHVVDYFLTHRPGHYLLVADGGRPRETRIRVKTSGGVRSVWPLLGLSLRDASSGTFEFAGPSGPGLVLFARFDASDDARFRVAVSHPTAGPAPVPTEIVAEPYRAGRALEILADEGMRLQIFHSLARAETTEPRIDDPQRLEALKTLGYVE